MNNANRQKLMNLNKEWREQMRLINSLQTKKEELRSKKNKNRANETTLRHVRSKLNDMWLRQAVTKQKQDALRKKVWKNIYPGQNYNWFLFYKWFKQNQKKYQARQIFGMSNLPIHLRELIVAKLIAK